MNIRNEEMVPLADMLHTSFKRDLAEIEAENKLYNASYLEKFKEMIEDVRSHEQSEKLTLNQKTITKKLYEVADEFKKPLQLLDIVFNKSNLTNSLLSEIIVLLRARNFEATMLKLSSLNQIIEQNKIVLSNNGMKDEFPDNLQKTMTAIQELSNEQTRLMQDRKLLTESKGNNYANLYNIYIKDICLIGKTIYQGSIKAEEYTVTKMMTKIRTNSSSNAKQSTANKS